MPNLPNDPESYPLCWPAYTPRSVNRKRASFSTRDSTYGSKQLTIFGARERLYKEFDLLPGVKDFILSSNVELTIRGVPRSDRKEPTDPGVCVYFDLGGKPHAMPCDKWDRVADNMAAIAKHVDAMRGMARWGVADLAQMFTGFAALPAPEALAAWWDVLGVRRDDAFSAIKAAWRDLCLMHHPDSPGGNVDKMAAINVAWEQAKAERGQ